MAIGPLRRRSSSRQRHRVLGALLLGCTAAAHAPAQGITYVVDEAMGPGAGFADIPEAIAQAAHGDRILVRRGSYSGFALHKGVAILGEDGATVVRPATSFVWVDINAPKGRTAAVHNLAFPVDKNAPSSLVVAHSEGRVLLERLRSSTLFVYGRNAQQVWMSHCDIGGIDLDKVHASLVRCGFNRTDIKLERFHACRFADSEVLLAGCDVVGYPFWGLAQPAIQASDGTRLTITGDGSESLRPCACQSSGKRVDVFVTQEDSIVVDPRVTAVFAMINGTPAVSRRPVPFLETRGAPLGGTVAVSLQAARGDAWYLAIGLPGEVVPVPDLGGAIWLDLGSAVLVAGGVVDASGVAHLAARVPVDTSLFGLTLVWQGIAGSPSGGMWLSNPSAYVHGAD
jgi:hypothetical protein